MAVDWSKIHVGFKRHGNKLFIGRGVISNNKIKWNAFSDDRTQEIVIAVMQKMRACMNDQGDPNKPYFGYKDDDFGTLLYIDKGYKFDLRPEPRSKK